MMILPDLDEFLKGPNSGDVDLDIDDIFGKAFSLSVSEMPVDQLSKLDPDERDVSDIDPDLYFADIECGLGLFDKNNSLIGGYLGCDLVLDDRYHGKGLGREIVVQYYLRNESLPTWDLDVAAYSRSGLAAHISAHEWLSNHVIKKTFCNVAG